MNDQNRSDLRDARTSQAAGPDVPESPYKSIGGLRRIRHAFGHYHHRLSGRTKDLGSAAVFIALLLCLLTWLLVAGPTLMASGRAMLSLALR